MFQNRYYLSNVGYRLAFRDNYVIDFSGHVDTNIDSKFIPDFACDWFKDEYGSGRPNLNMKDSKILDKFADDRHINLGLKPSTAYLQRVDLHFGMQQLYGTCLKRNDLISSVMQGYYKAAIDATYIYYIGEKTVRYEYKLSNGTVILEGKATIKDNCILSYIKHFMMKMSSVDISPYN